MHVVRPLSGLPLLSNREEKKSVHSCRFTVYTLSRENQCQKYLLNGLKFDTLNFVHSPTSPGKQSTKWKRQKCTTSHKSHRVAKFTKN